MSLSRVDVIAKLSFVQAYVLSLAAGTFHDSHLEIGVDPADLHRELSVKGIEIAAGEKVSIEVRLDDENRPFLLVGNAQTRVLVLGFFIRNRFSLEKSSMKLCVNLKKKLAKS